MFLYVNSFYKQKIWLGLMTTFVTRVDAAIAAEMAKLGTTAMCCQCLLYPFLGRYIKYFTINFIIIQTISIFVKKFHLCDIKFEILITYK